MSVLYRLICMVCGRQGLGVEFTVRLMSRPIFPLPRLPLGLLRSPIFFALFPQCGAWSQAKTVIRWMHMQVMQQSLLHSVIKVRFRNTSTVLIGRLFDSPCRPGIYLPQKKESRAWSQLSAGQAYSKIRVLAKSRKWFNFEVYSGFTTWFWCMVL